MTTVRNWFAAVLRDVKSTRTVRCMDGNSDVHIRCRSRIDDVLIMLGNVLLWSIGAKVRVLRMRAWQSWEPAAYRALENVEVKVDRAGRIVVRTFEGQLLSNVLRSDADSQTKRRAISIAMRELTDAHAVSVEGRPFTHADATVRNVIVDLDRHIGHWIDFETQHTENAPLAWRRADDLRALVESAAECWRDADEVVQAVLASNPSPAMLRALCDELNSGSRNLYQLAQAKLNRAQREQLASRLLDRWAPGNKLAPAGQ